MILSKKYFSNNFILFVNLVFSFFPITFVLGNFATNVNIVLFCCLGLYYLKFDIFNTKLYFSIKIIFLFFCVIFFSTLLSFLNSLYYTGHNQVEFSNLVKSIGFFRFFLFLLLVYLLNKNDILNFKYFFIVSFFTCILVSADVIFQYFYGYNIIGLKSYGHYNTSFFGDEFISGGFIQNFSFFALFFLAYKYKEKLILRFFLINIAICIIGTGILLSGNRMPFLLYLLGLFVVILLTNNLRKIVPGGLLVLFIIFGYFISIDKSIKTNYNSFYANYKKIALSGRDFIILDNRESKIEILKENSSEDFEEDENLNPSEDETIRMGTGHQRLFLTALDTWKMNKIFGNGLKSFRTDCVIIDTLKRNRLCSNHPHNYYLEILTETGIIGLITIISLAVIFLVFIFKNLKIIKGDRIDNFILLAAIMSLILAAFPLKSTGSIFTTNNAAYLAIISSIILPYKKTLSLKN